MVYIPSSFIFRCLSRLGDDDAPSEWLLASASTLLAGKDKTLLWQNTTHAKLKGKLDQ